MSLKKKYLSGISTFLHTLNRARFYKWNRVQIVVCYDWIQKHKYLSRISKFLHETFKTMISQWDINVSAWNLQNRARFSMLSPNSDMDTKTISVGYQRFCTKPSEQGSFFQAGRKWVQIVVCYDQNLQKHKYLSGISTFLHETFRTIVVEMSPNSGMLQSKLTKI